MKRKIILTALILTFVALAASCGTNGNEPAPLNTQTPAAILTGGLPDETMLALGTATPDADFEFLEISDDGVMLTKYTGESTEVVIPETVNEKIVTAIGAKAFADRQDVERVYISATITNIDASVFDGSPNVVIVTTAGSAAHNYAAQSRIKYDLY